MAPVIPVIAAAWTCVDSGSVVPVRLRLLTGWDEPMDGVLAVEAGVLQLAGRLAGRLVGWPASLVDAKKLV